MKKRRLCVSIFHSAVCTAFLGLVCIAIPASAQVSTVGELFNNTLGNVTQNGLSGDILQNAVTAAVTDEALDAVRDVLDNVSAPAEVEAAAQQISSLLDINIAAAEQVVISTLNGDLLGSSLQDTLNGLMAEAVAEGIDGLLGGRTSAELMQIVSGLLGGLNGATTSPAALLAALSNLGIPLSSLGLSEEHLNALLGLSVPLCPAGPAATMGDCSLAWSPDIGEFCNASGGRAPNGAGANNQNDRVSCGTAPDGGPAMQISEFQGSAVSLQGVGSPFPASFAGLDSMAMSMEFFMPEDFEVTANGRMPLGIAVGTGGVGLQVASEQQGSTIRTSFQRAGDSIVFCIYSYHLDRTTSVGETDRHYGGSEGEIGQSGQPACTTTPIPKGEWVTVTLGMALGQGGTGNDSSFLQVADSTGAVIDTAAWEGVTYRTDPSWQFSRMASDDKRNGPGNVPRDQSYFIRNYGGYDCTGGSAATDPTAPAEGTTPTSGPI